MNWNQKKSVGKFDYTRKNEKYKAAMQDSWYNNRKIVRIICMVAENLLFTTERCKLMLALPKNLSRRFSLQFFVLEIGKSFSYFFFFSFLFCFVNVVLETTILCVCVVRCFLPRWLNTLPLPLFRFCSVDVVTFFLSRIVNNFLSLDTFFFFRKNCCIFSLFCIVF